MTRITEGHLARHYQGLRGGRDAALLDIAQDHALHVLHNSGLFDRGLVFKGGTALPAEYEFSSPRNSDANSSNNSD
jgi:uncharacterized protein